MTKYRIWRVDPHNIAIQRKIATKSGRDKWTTISYHGHSLASLVSGLLQLPLRNYTPVNEKLSEQLVNIELELIRGLARLEKMVEDWKVENEVKK